MNGEIPVGFQLNGARVDVTVPVEMCLADLLRERLFLTGTKVSCDQGVCGACTVLIDGHPAAACSTFAFDADGRAVTTIEGLAPAGELHPLQRAFVEGSAIQCGFCTPGIILSCTSLLDEHPQPTRNEVAEWLKANVCRCTGYQMIEESVVSAGRTGANA